MKAMFLIYGFAVGSARSVCVGACLCRVGGGSLGAVG